MIISEFLYVDKFCTIYESGVLAKGGGERCLRAEKLEPKYVKMLYLLITAAMTDIQSSNLNAII